jgi:hypothetical protein
MSKRFDVIVLGTVLGTATGWDEVDVDCVVYFDFEPSLTFVKLANDVVKNQYEGVAINFTTGTVECYEHDRIPLSFKLKLFYV